MGKGGGGRNGKRKKSSLSVEVLILNKEVWVLAGTLGARGYLVNSPQPSLQEPWRSTDKVNVKMSRVPSSAFLTTVRLH